MEIWTKFCTICYNINDWTKTCFITFIHHFCIDPATSIFHLLFSGLLYLTCVIFSVMSTPVILWTVSGRLFIISRTSFVRRLAPIGPSPVDTIVIFLVFNIGVLTSLATSGNTYRNKYGITIISTCMMTKWTTFSIMSTRAACLYSFQASAFLAICSASALAFTSTA